ncbi:Proprotein convertase subtilisin/kexin type 4 [Heterocephalus glaber]|uniref:Proprotein convertase subtilisin/kexin type 4 n=1 Tax=Heterocephalus glaber TaxID=10181 RepID=G5BW47_HETGA|nr:Proprotein convertase subtilisin/kexin type 4 [Heterocephalus glaber]
MGRAPRPVRTPAAGPGRSARSRPRRARSLVLVRPLAVGWKSARVPIYVSSWAVQVTQGNREAERLARKFGFVNLGQIFPDGQYFHLRHRGVAQQSLSPHWGHRLRLKKDPKVPRFEQQTVQRRVKRSLEVPMDPWYVKNEMQPDLNILRSWAQGLMGQGVVISILDGGIEKDHPDLWANYMRPQAAGTGADPLASYDFNDYDPDPQPRYTPSNENRHGTRCAGGVAAMANNGFCSAGVAFNARIGGVRMLDGTIADILEAQSLSLQPQHIHVYSASWGPEDNGRRVDGPGILSHEAFLHGVTQVTTDLHHQCTDNHTGTSASAPLAGGMMALALEANLLLTWRDTQHLMVRASKPAHLQAEDWRTNGVGRQVSHHYGYGLLDAALLVDLAHIWLPTQPQRKCTVEVVMAPLQQEGPYRPQPHPAPDAVEKKCIPPRHYIRALEHVQVQLSLSYSHREDLEISLTSPMGTRSTLVAIRPLDNSSQGYNNWTFMSTHFWDENPQGLWAPGLWNKSYYFSRGMLHRCTLLLYGTAEDMMAQPPGSQVTECDNATCILGHLCLSGYG